MIIAINAAAAGGSGFRKWKRVEESLRASNPPPEMFLLNGSASTARMIRSGLDRGETRFVAAGGDGTVNTLLNALLFISTPSQRRTLLLGAIGLGSSNDFHKPSIPGSMIDGVPARINFHDAPLRDIGTVSFETAGGFQTRYFIVNASIGITAEANLLFNRPGRVLEALKRTCTPAAILFAALKTIRSYRNIGITLRRPGRAERDLQLTNLALLKNPNVSGSFRYDAIIPPDDGLLHAYLFTGMNKPRLLRLLLALSKGLTPPAMRGPGIESFNESSLIVAAARPFALEFDGEVVATSFAQFGVLHRHLRVCRS
jgi:diacylglycerol kinase family enzyme